MKNSNLTRWLLVSYTPLAPAAHGSKLLLELPFSKLGGSFRQTQFHFYLLLTHE